MRERRQSDRRRRLVAIRIPDRRYGFPRRSTSGGLRGRYNDALTFVRDNPTAFVLLASLLLALNLADLALTQRALAAGAVETNPVMAALFEADMGIAAAVKLSLSSVIVGTLWLLRRYRPALSTLVILCLGMGALVAYQTAFVIAIT